MNFWTLTCINWLRQEPYVRAWSQAYRDDGLIVIGVHTPGVLLRARDRPRAPGDEGASDRLPGRRRQRLRDLGRLRQPLLAGALLRRPRTASSATSTSAKGATSNPSASSSGCSASSASSSRSRGSAWRREADWDHLQTPETYLGYERGGPPGRRRVDERAYSSPSAWASTTGPSPASGRSSPRASCSPRPAGASPTASTRATRISCCHAGARAPIAFRVLLDGEAPGPARGEDVDEDGNGLLRRRPPLPTRAPA